MLVVSGIARRNCLTISGARAMGWPKPSEIELLCQFLEPNPPTNRKGTLQILWLAFYSSELKALSQACSAMKEVAAGRPLAPNEDTAKRYRNTLTNLGLLSENATPDALTELGARVVNELSVRGLAPGDLSGTNLASAVQIESLLFDALLARAVENDLTDRPTKYFRDLLLHAQLFVDGIGNAALQPLLAGTSEALDQLFFLQSIHSVGFEAARYFKLTPEQRQTAFELWAKLSDPASFPESAGTSVFEKAVRAYVRPVAKNSIQRDLRFRVHAFLTAYSAARARLGKEFPVVSPDLVLLNGDKLNSTKVARRSFSLPPQSSPSPVTLPRQRLICGCPGSGKSRLAKSQADEANMHVVQTTFHSESAYFDFVGTYKPTPLYEKAGSVELYDAAGVSSSRGLPHITYEFIPGAFTRAYLLAKHNPLHNVVLIIEELNRANPSAVFGDMFQLLDRDATTGESTHATIPSPDLLAYLAASGAEPRPEGIRLPSNLFIWATMNSADQGVFPLDSAFRRRWQFEYLGHRTRCAYPTEQRQLKYAGKMVDWDLLREKVNERLVDAQIHEDKLIGPYFLTPLELADPDRVLNKLFLYLWEDVLRFQHSKLMKDYGSFSQLAEDWNKGLGAPFAIDV